MPLKNDKHYSTPMYALNATEVWQTISTHWIHTNLLNQKKILLIKTNLNNQNTYNFTLTSNPSGRLFDLKKSYIRPSNDLKHYIFHRLFLLHLEKNISFLLNKEWRTWITMKGSLPDAGVGRGLSHMFQKQKRTHIDGSSDARLGYR